MKLLEKASLAGHLLGGQANGNCCFLLLCKISQAGYEPQCPAFGPQMTCQVSEKLVNGLSAALPSVQVVVYPLTGSLFRLDGQVGRIEN